MYNYFQILTFTTVLALVQCHSDGNFQFTCDTPDEWLGLGQGQHSVYPGELWPNATVTYELHSSLTSSDTTEIYKAFYDIQNKTCIRFVPRSANESAYVSIEHDDDTCGVAHVCRTGGYQFARFGGGCAFANVMIHELGHTLCLGHEQTRKDRDDFVHFDPCQEGEKPGRDDFETRGHFYDYNSQMHYQCNWCPGGWPKTEGVSKCGMDVQEGLSVLDADKVNDFYDCKACLSHRWRRTENLTETDRENLVPFGLNNVLEYYYLCRTYVGGEIAAGKYNLTSGNCHVSWNGTEHTFSSNVQVFTLPTDGTLGVNYQFLPVESSDPDDFVPVGRTPSGDTVYAATSYVEKDNYWELSIGKVYKSNMTQAYMTVQGQVLLTDDFKVVGCN